MNTAENVSETKPKKSTVNLTFYGQAGFKIDLPSGKVVIIDPWIVHEYNPKGEEMLESIHRCDVMLLTHGHFDHTADAVAVARKTGAPLVAPKVLGEAMVTYLGYPEENGIRTAAVGEIIQLLDGEMEVEFTKAVHGSSIQDPKTNQQIETGVPTGIIMRFNDGPTIYHAGDTALFDEMSSLVSPGEVDLYQVCIGGHYTMDPKEAAEATKRIHPKAVMPIHYGTLPVLFGTADDFKAELKELGLNIPVHVIKAGETISFG